MLAGSNIVSATKAISSQVFRGGKGSIRNVFEGINKAGALALKGAKGALGIIEGGFKGLFKIIDVRMDLVTGANGVKQYAFTVTGKAFDEFNTLLYYNPAIVDAEKKANPIFFLSSFPFSLLASA